MYVIRFVTNEGFYFDYQKRGRFVYTKRGAERIANRLFRLFGYTCYLIEAND
jgi:predicted transcriptional regulator